MGIGVIGILFKYFNWSRPALLVGFVLSATVETYLYQAVQFYDFSTAIARPGVVMIIIFIVGSLTISIIYGKKVKEKPHLEKTGDEHVDSLLLEEEERESEAQHQERLHYTFWSGEGLFVLAVLGLAGYTLVDSRLHSFLGSVFPMSVGVVMMVSGLILFYQLTSRRWQAAVIFHPLLEQGKLSKNWVDTWKNFLWIVGLCASTWLLGYVVSIALLFISLIRIKAKASWPKTLFITLIAVGFLLFVQNLIVLHLPTGFIYDNFIFNPKS